MKQDEEEEDEVELSFANFDQEDDPTTDQDQNQNKASSFATFISYLGQENQLIIGDNHGRVMIKDCGSRGITTETSMKGDLDKECDLRLAGLEVNNELCVVDVKPLMIPKALFPTLLPNEDETNDVSISNSKESLVNEMEESNEMNEGLVVASSSGTLYFLTKFFKFL